MSQGPRYAPGSLEFICYKQKGESQNGCYKKTFSEI